jgi:hypothetical protein
MYETLKPVIRNNARQFQIRILGINLVKFVEQNVLAFNTANGVGVEGHHIPNSRYRLLNKKQKIEFWTDNSIEAANTRASRAMTPRTGRSCTRWFGRSGYSQRDGSIVVQASNRREVRDWKSFLPYMSSSYRR